MLITLFYIPVPDEATASSLGSIAIEKKLAACANLFPITSIFPWEGTIQNSNEIVLVLKTIPYKKNELRIFIEENHPYEVPCIMSWDVEVNKEYGDWIKSNVN